MSRSSLYALALRFLEPALSRGPLRRLLARRATRALQAGGELTFVCYGNIARSPFAQRVMLIAGTGTTVTSAGTFPATGRPSTREAVAEAAAFGVDLGGHRSRVLHRDAIRAADAIFVFDLRNWLSVMRLDPRSCRRLHFVGALTPGGPLQIDDPHGRGRDAYARAYARINSALGAAP